MSCECSSGNSLLTDKELDGKECSVLRTVIAPGGAGEHGNETSQASNDFTQVAPPNSPTCRGGYPQQREGLKPPEAKLLSDGQRSGNIPKYVVIVDDVHVADLPSTGAATGRMQMLATRIPALQQSPGSASPEREVS